MTTINRHEQLALLLELLGDDAKQAALANLDRKVAGEIKRAFQEFEKHPPLPEEIDFVIDDFEKFFRFALERVDPDDLETARSIDRGSDKNMILQIAEENFDVSLEPTKKFNAPELTGNLIHDLNLMHPYQVACAVENDLPVIIALVIRNLATEHAAKTLEFLAQKTRSEVFVELSKPSMATPIVADQIIKTALDRALEIDERRQTEDSNEQMVSLLRSLPKDVRTPMFEELKKANEQLAEEVKSKLYQFDDLNRVEDRDLQKILAQTSSSDLVLALQGADEELIRRILKNMSQRASDALKEEMEFATNAKQEEIDGGRTAVVKILAELDESGAISLT